MNETHISLAHGNGGRFMRELIEDVFARHLGNPYLDCHADAATLGVMDPNAALMCTTDGFTVQPLEFPGGNIGSLAIHGTVNDLAVAGARPLYLNLNVFMEEGLEMALLDRIVATLAHTARDCGVVVVAGDTKVLPRGEAGGLLLATTGIGVRATETRLGLSQIRPGDQILVSGPVGDHGTAVMLAREQFGLRGDLQSDAASVLPLTEAVLGLPGLRFMRDPTRGGLATVLHEIHRSTGLGISIRSAQVPVRQEVEAVCEILGYDPYYLACEGRVVAVVAAEDAQRALSSWLNLPHGHRAAIIGEVSERLEHVVQETELGGQRILEELEDDPLPRIC